MKKQILLLTLLTCNFAQSDTHDYNQLANFEDFDGIFILSDQNNPDTKVKLDCQSYFHKMDILDSQNNILSENYITFGECEFLYNNYTQCLNNENVKCVDSEDIFNEDCNCKN